MEFTTRYDALGIPLPDPEAMCKGQCEGIGIYPQFVRMRPAEHDELEMYTEDCTPQELQVWLECHKKCNLFDRFLNRWKHMEWWYWKSLFRGCDGWHFIKCADCNGTGRKA